MFIGHLGVGLALKKIDRRTNVGWFVASALLLDLLLWLFVLLNMEEVTIPENYSKIHYLFFNFPYSHSLVASLGWSAMIFVVVKLISTNSLTAGAMALGVFSHFLLDVIAHPAQIPLGGEDSFHVGLALWNVMPAELTLEFVILASGLYVYLSTSTASGVTGKYGLPMLMGLVTVAAFGGQLMGPAPESAGQVAVSSIITMSTIVLLTIILDRKRIPLTV